MRSCFSKETAERIAAPQNPSRTKDGACSVLGVVGRKQVLCCLNLPDRGVPDLPLPGLSTDPSTVTTNRIAICSALKNLGLLNGPDLRFALNGTSPNWSI